MTEPLERTEPVSPSAPPAVNRLGRLALLVGVVASVLAVVGLAVDTQQFFRSYLVGWTYWLAVALGSLALLMIQHLSGGAWGVVARRIFESAAKTLPFLAALFVPLWLSVVFHEQLGIEPFYEWAVPSLVEEDAILAHRAPFQNDLWWSIRSALYLAVWSILALLLARYSRRQDENGDPDLLSKMRVVSGPGMVLWFIATTFAAFDWYMALDAHWYSTIYGVWFIGGSGLAALAFTILIALLLARQAPMDTIFRKNHFHDYGKLMLAATMLWAYFSLSQFLIIWSGNVPEFTMWYQKRLVNGWDTMAVALALLQFVLPFVLLLSRDLKRDIKLLAGVAFLILLVRWVDLYWNAAPAFYKQLTVHWLDPVTLLAVGGLWLWLFCRFLAQRPLLPINDPYLEEALADGGHH